MKKRVMVLSVILSTQILIAKDSNNTEQESLLPKIDIAEYLKPDDMRTKCDKKDFDSCTNLGYLYSHGKYGVKKDISKAFQLYKKACEGGSNLGCSNLAFFYLEGKGTKINKKRAFTLYQKLCKKNDLISCGTLGSMYEIGEGTKKNINKAKKLYKKVCDGKIKRGCSYYKRLQENNNSQ